MGAGAAELEVGATQVDEGAGATQEEEEVKTAASATGVDAGAAEEDGRTLQRFCLLACLGSRRAS